MATVTVFPHGTMTVGSHQIGPISVPQSVSAFTLALARAEWVAGVTLSMNVDLSLDGGATWNEPAESVVPFPLGLTAEGGVALDKNGIPYVATTLSAQVPNPGSATRQVRATVVVAGGPLVTIGTLTTS